MGSRPVMNATDRYKMLLANALERVCVLEEALENVSLELESIKEQLNVQNGNAVEKQVSVDSSLSH